MRSLDKPHTLTHFIVQDLGVAIVTGKYAAAPFPTESALCHEYGAARTILREAVKMLSAKGLLQARPRKGTVIAPEDHWNLFDPDVVQWLLQRPFSLDLLIEVTQFRLGVEPTAACLAARNLTDAGRAEIIEAVQRMNAAEVGSDDSLAANRAFHIAVLQASGNRFCRQLHDMIETSAHFSPHLAGLTGRRLESLEDHQHVANAIIEGDGVRAEKAMRDMIQGALELMLNIRTGKSEVPASEARQWLCAS